jgi:hypothetical protein
VPQNKANERTWDGWWILKICAVVFLCGLVLVAIAVPTTFRSGPPRFGSNLKRARDVATLCDAHAKEHGGSYPKSLYDVDPHLDDGVSKQ